MALTEEQKKLIKELYDNKTNTYIAELIGCPRKEITTYANRNGLVKPVELQENRCNFISEEDAKKMLEEYPTTDDEVLMEKYHISKSCIHRLSTKFGAHKTRDYITAKWKQAAIKAGRGVDDEMEKRIVELFPNHCYEELEKILGIGMAKIRTVANRLGLKKSDEYIKKTREKALECLALGRKNSNGKQETTKKEPKPKKEKVEKPKKVATKKEIQPKKTAKQERKIDSDYTFVPDEKLIRLCNDDEFGIKGKKSTEPCIGKKCVCFKYCHKNKQSVRKICDAYMYLR